MLSSRWIKKYAAPFLVVLGLVILGSFLHAPKSSAAAVCSFNGTWVQVNVFVRVIHPNGTVTYSNDFKFNVTASLPPGSPAGPFLDQTIAPNGGHSQNITATGHTHSCPVNGSNQPAYDFTDGSNGNFLLNCLGGATHGQPIDSASFSFSVLSPGTAAPGGKWLGATTVAFHPTTTQDLNYANQRTVIFNYQEPAPVNRPPTGKITLGCTADGSGDGTARMDFSDPDGGDPLGYFAVPGSGAPLTGQHHTGFIWIVPAARADTTSWSLWLYVQDIGGSGFVLVTGASHASCAVAPSGPTGQVHVACNPDGTGRAYATGVTGASAIFFANTAGAAVSGTHPIDWVWNPVNVAVAPPGSNWTLRLGVVPSSGGAPIVLPGSASITCSLSPTATCTPSTFPGNMEVNTAQSFKVSANINPAPPSPPTNPALTVDITGPGGYNKKFLNQNYTYSAAAKSITSSPMSFTPPTPGTYNLTCKLTGFVTLNCVPDSGDAGTYPYFEVEGGDIAAGAGFGTTSCTQSTADIASWNYDNSPTGYYGAGSQMATLASGDLRSFVTGLNPAGNTTNPGGRTGSDSLNFVGTPRALSFANAGPGVNITASHYGGSFTSGGGLLPCITDYAAAITGGSPWGGSFASSGVFTKSGLTVLDTGGTDIPHDTVIKLKVNGNVYIKSDINYDDSGGPLHYPRLTVVATGNIYVASTVNTIHGLFVAQGASPSGVFATCAKLSGAVVSETTDYNTCNNSLTVYGGVAATKLNLERTSGTRTSNNPPAESFRYTPELWLATPECTALPAAAECTAAGVAGQKTDAIISLPPVL